MVGSYSGPYGHKRPACQIQVCVGGGGILWDGAFEEAQARRLAAWRFLA